MKNSVLILCLLLPVYSFAQLAAVRLTCEHKIAPEGVERPYPALSWELQSSTRSVMQSAYRILVSDDPQELEKNTGSSWDSKKVNSQASINVPYNGRALQSVRTYYWKVMVWDDRNRVSAWSKTGVWQMGLLAAGDWKGATWIGYEKIPDSLVNILPADGMKDTYTGSNVLPLLRKSFAIGKPVKKATMFICGLGHFELSFNGKKTGDHFLDPGWTKYDKQALYVPFDLTAQIRQGPNAIGVMLGNGFYYIPPVPGRYRKLKVAFGYPKMICRLAIEYTDGSQESIISDASWKTAPGPITFSSIYGGEDYNAALEQQGWDTPAFNDAAWRAAVTVGGPAVLNAQMTEPVKVMETFRPKKKTLLQPGTWVYDMGQNASGIPQIKVQGRRGDTVRIFPGELLKENGWVNQKSSGSPYYLQYIVKGDGVEIWQPRFTYYGYRYLQISGAVPEGEANPQKLAVLKGVTGMHTRNAAARTGSFSCSAGLFNRTATLIDWAIKSNMVSLFTDCPHREKLGWLEEAHLMGNSIQYNYDVSRLYEKQVSDIIFSQTDEGLVPEIAPEYVKFNSGGDIFRDSPEWGSSGILLPWYLYQWYGDRQLLESSYPMMKRYAAYLQTTARGFIQKKGLGDWYDIGPKPPGVSQLTPMGVTGTAMYYYDLTILSDIAKLLDKKEEAAAYGQTAFRVKQAFNDTFFNKQTAQYATGSQTANAMAVYMKLVEPQYKDAVVQHIVDDIRNRGNSLTAGDIGYRYLLKVLQEEDRPDVIYDMNSRTDVPGYGYQLAKGATALTESWQAYANSSNNHFMLGHIMEWFYGGLAGISQKPGSVAYREVMINPQPAGGITQAKASYHSMYGTVTSEWKKEKGRFTLTTSIPPNTTATIYLPAARIDAVTEGNRPLSGKDIQFTGIEKGKVVLQAGSGTYTFVVRYVNTAW